LGLIKYNMSNENTTWSASYKEYERGAEQYILSLDNRAARMTRIMENAMRIFTEFIYGYLPAAGEMEWPVLKPNYDISVGQEHLVPFHEAYSYGITKDVIHFFEADNLFTRIFCNPCKYLPFLRNCKGVIGPDLSQYTDMPAEMRYRHAWCNVTMSAYLQEESVNLYPNVTWSKGDSFFYSCPRNLASSVIAINSNAVHRSSLSLYRWKKGYEFVTRELHPIHIVRYGQPVDGEMTGISSYHVNERLQMLRNGR
jgi:hypothetical protein